MNGTIIFLSPAHRTPLIDISCLPKVAHKGRITAQGKIDAVAFAKTLPVVETIFTSPMLACVETVKALNLDVDIIADANLTVVPDDFPGLTQAGREALYEAGKFIKLIDLAKGSEGILELRELNHFEAEIEGLDYDKLNEHVTTVMNEVLESFTNDSALGYLLDKCFVENETTLCCVPDLTLFALARHMSPCNLEAPKSLSTLIVSLSDYCLDATYNGVTLNQY